MADLTIRADIVAAGAGLPLSIVCDGVPMFYANDGQDQDLHLYRIDASDPQTAFGLAMRLDEWERAARHRRTRPPEWRGIIGNNWSMALTMTFGNPDPERRHHLLTRMLARIERIGLDHAVRRALGWAVEPGTLCDILREDGGCWVFVGPYPTGPEADFPEVRGITDPIEALRAIHAEVTRG